MVVVSPADSDSRWSVVVPVVVVLEVVMVHSTSTVQFRIEHCLRFQDGVTSFDMLLLFLLLFSKSLDKSHGYCLINYYEHAPRRLKFHF